LRDSLTSENTTEIPKLSVIDKTGLWWKAKRGTVMSERISWIENKAVCYTY